MSLSSFFSSFVGTLHADAPEESKISEVEPQEVEEVVVEAVEVEEDEPEDVRFTPPPVGVCH
jgi:ubiquinol-cytochrome c reductase subunit 6